MIGKFTNLILNKKFDNSFWFLIASSYRRVLYFYMNFHTPQKRIEKHFLKIFERPLHLYKPKYMNEKIQWLKLYDHKDYYTLCGDKYEVRNWLRERFSTDYLIPLVFHTNIVKEINPNNITKYPCIVKANHSSKDYEILRSADSVDWKQLRRKCCWWLGRDYYLESLEWQYKNIKRQIVVEELLQTKEGKIPNDYKLHFFNGELKFVYVSVDREGENCRNIYDPNWKPLFFDWSGTDKNAKSRRGGEVPAPPSFDEMKVLGSKIAKDFPYVRIDYYDVDGKLYFGEITLHHGGGFDVFIPEEYDLICGNMLSLVNINGGKQ